jgi:hypothetical protein
LINGALCRSCVEDKLASGQPLARFATKLISISTSCCICSNNAEKPLTHFRRGQSCEFSESLHEPSADLPLLGSIRDTATRFWGYTFNARTV